MRRVAQKEIGKQEHKDNQEQILEQLRMLNNTVEALVTALDGVTERLLSVEALAAQAEQYEKDHNELHRDIATRAADETKTLQQTVAMVMEKLAKLPELKVDIPAPQVTVETPEPGEKTYKIKRNQSGLIDEVVEKPSG